VSFFCEESSLSASRRRGRTRERVGAKAVELVAAEKGADYRHAPKKPGGKNALWKDEGPGEGNLSRFAKGFLLPDAVSLFPFFNG